MLGFGPNLAQSVIARHRKIYPFLALSLAAYTSLHVGDFDEKIWGEKVTTFRSSAAEFCLRRRPLACLSGFLQSEGWIFGTEKGS